MRCSRGPTNGLRGTFVTPAGPRNTSFWRVPSVRLATTSVFVMRGVGRGKLLQRVEQWPGLGLVEVLAVEIS